VNEPATDKRLVGHFLADLAEIGRDPRGGWSRLAFGPEERRAHRLFTEWARRLGLRVWDDPVGNTFAELGGRSDGPALLAGSHLDTVPRGGNFDGGAGVAAAIEAARLLEESGGLDRPYRVVVFSAEEGARFGAPCIGSRVATGAFTEATLRELRDREGRSVADCAAAVGLRPEAAAQAVWAPGSVAGYLEVHIEQGRVLESRGLTLGVVDSIAGSTRLQLDLKGRPDHSGATPMPLRRDALAGACELVLEAERLAGGQRTAVATVGRLEVEPGSLTTVPGAARVFVDVRDIDSERQRQLAEDLLDGALRVAGRRGLLLSAELLSDQSPVVLHKPVREQLVAAARDVGASFCILPSGASHDAAHVARVAPAGMLFVPSRDGVSHAPEEWSSAEDIGTAAAVLSLALRALDRAVPPVQAEDEVIER
jgi:allantoate deiminase